MKKEQLLKMLKSNKIKNVYVFCNWTTNDGEYFKVSKNEAIKKVERNEDVEYKVQDNDGCIYFD